MRERSLGPGRSLSTSLVTLFSWVNLNFSQTSPPPSLLRPLLHKTAALDGRSNFYLISEVSKSQSGLVRLSRRYVVVQLDSERIGLVWTVGINRSSFVDCNMFSVSLM